MSTARRSGALALFFLLLVSSSAANAVETHPFSIHDMLAMSRISDPHVSPDGKSAAFAVRVTDMDANKGWTSVWLADLATKRARRLTGGAANDSSPRFSPDGQGLYFLSTRGGSSQVWRLPLSGGEAVRVTAEPRS